MSEALTTYLVSVALLAALALLVPCIESLVGLMRRSPRKPDTSPAPQPAESRKRHIA